MKQRVLNWKRDLPDQRDYKLSRPVNLTSPPPKIDLRVKCPPIVNQFNTGSCTGNAWAAILGFDELKWERLKIETAHDEFGDGKFDAISRLFFYWCEREIEGTTNQDAGAQIRTGVRVLQKFGICREVVWPYADAKALVHPSDAAYKEGSHHLGLVGFRLNQDLESMKSCLAAGFPFVFGISVYDSFQSDEVAQSGVVPMPGQDENNQGGHAIACVGYDDEKQWFIVRNSWGTEWGDQGYCYIPYDYLTNSDLAADFWTLRKTA